MYRGVTIGLCGDSGSGKTSLSGELVKHVRRTRGKNSLLKGADQGGYEPIRPLEDVGILTVDLLDSQEDDPWSWINSAVKGDQVDDSIGLVIIDSGTGLADALLMSCAALAAKGEQIGGRPAPKFQIGRGEKALKVGSNVDSHYLVVQTFLMDMIRSSSWLTKRGVDVLWTWGIMRGEKQDEQLILGPKGAGKASTPQIPKEFNYFFTLQTIPVEGQPSRHILNIQEQPAQLGGGSVGMFFGNARYPLDATTSLPAQIEPASLVTALSLIQAGREEASASIRAELGL